MLGTGEGESIELKHWLFNNFIWTSLLEQITAWLENGSGNNNKETIRSAKNLYILGPIFESTQSKSSDENWPNYWLITYSLLLAVVGRMKLFNLFNVNGAKLLQIA